MGWTDSENKTKGVVSFSYTTYTPSKHCVSNCMDAYVPYASVIEVYNEYNDVTDIPLTAEMDLLDAHIKMRVYEDSKDRSASEYNRYVSKLESLLNFKVPESKTFFLSSRVSTRTDITLHIVRDFECKTGTVFITVKVDKYALGERTPLKYKTFSDTFDNAVDAFAFINNFSCIDGKTIEDMSNIKKLVFDAFKFQRVV